MTVSFSTRAPNSDYLGFDASPEAIVAAAKKAEEVGFDAIFVNDHILVGDDTRSAPWTNSMTHLSRCRLSLRTRAGSGSASRC
jgi:alkanesulfonate monooxygenase SsuD/methylene tetrahydromethanopterin reductase-like flavin-dependent oxidoreductase (luciferase family)